MSADGNVIIGDGEKSMISLGLVETKEILNRSDEIKKRGASDNHFDSYRSCDVSGEISDCFGEPFHEEQSGMTE